jgi:hypothetical protein
LKVAIVVGFFDPVWAELQREYAAHVAEKTLILVKPALPSPIPRIPDVASRVADASGRAKSLLVVAASLDNYEWVPMRIEEMVVTIGRRTAGLEVRTEIRKSATDPKEILQLIADFALEPPLPISVELLRTALRDTKVLCVSMEGRTTLRDALMRAGFPEEAWDLYFVERIIPGARNSNLLNSIGLESHQCTHLLYAWDGLRTLSSAVKKKFKGKQYECPTAAQVAEAFKRWVLKFKKAGG